MNAVRRYLPAALCLCALPLCALLVHPHLDIGINDDWAYTKSAQVFAQTGHIVYTEWQNAMLGWQVVFAAALIKLFGSSCDVVRASTLLVAMATAFVVHRSFVRAGITPWNAALGTLALVLSPLFLPLAFSFMTDVYGLFAITLCLYGCLRALQADGPNAAEAWIAFAVVSGAVGGTSRQISWLGVLVMVPSTIWLLRAQRPRILLRGAALYVASVVFIAAMLLWFGQQPRSLQESMFLAKMDLYSLRHLLLNLLRIFLELTFLLFPALFVFLAALWRGHRRALSVIVLVSGIVLLVGWSRIHAGAQLALLAPYLGNYITEHGVIDGTPILGERPVILHEGTRLLLSTAAAAAMAGFLCFFFLDAGSKGVREVEPTSASTSVSWHQLAVLIGPFSVAYFVLLLPRAVFSQVFDRYLLPLMLVAGLLLLRYAQERIPGRLPLIALVPVFVFAGFGVAATHDAFAMFRARLALAEELRSSGVPANVIDAGLEYNGVTQADGTGFPDYPPYRNPGPCETQNNYLFHDLDPRYALSFAPGLCGGPAGFAPVSYRAWLGPHTVAIYVVSVSRSSKPSHP